MLFTGCFCAVLACGIIAVQLGMREPKTRNILTDIDILDGAILAGTDSILDVGHITLTINSGTPSDKIKILVNGEEIDVFNSDTKEIKITNQSVIEINNTGKSEVSIALKNISDNLTTVLNNEEITVKGTKILCRVIFKK